LVTELPPTDIYGMAQEIVCGNGDILGRLCTEDAVIVHRFLVVKRDVNSLDIGQLLRERDTLVVAFKSVDVEVDRRECPPHEVDIFGIEEPDTDVGPLVPFGHDINNCGTMDADSEMDVSQVMKETVEGEASGSQ
jgi:hypothetical protein